MKVTFQHTDSLRFECSGCGACCMGGPDHYVTVSSAEAAAMRKHLGLSQSWFQRRYLRRYGDGFEVRFRTDGACAFLGRDQRCRVYPVRPAQCRRYPLWPELLASQSAWQREGRRCEGIGRGAVIPWREIAAVLRTKAPDSDA